MEINIGINHNDRAAIAGGLSRLLADSYTLYLKTHNYHWNVTGPQFTSLHTLFETQYTELALAVDLIAERIRALGERAPGSYREFSALSSIDEDTDRPSANTMIGRLVAGLGQFAGAYEGGHGQLVGLLAVQAHLGSGGGHGLHEIEHIGWPRSG